MDGDMSEATTGRTGRPWAPAAGDGLRVDRTRGRLADEVYDTLLGQLMSLRIEPGSRVTIDALALELRVSQTPIRDALNRMEADGLVVRVPHAGYRIPPQITRERFEDMVEIRLLLEPSAARHAAERASSEQVSGLPPLKSIISSIAVITSIGSPGGRPSSSA